MSVVHLCSLQSSLLDEAGPKPAGARYSSEQILRYINENPAQSAPIWDKLFASTTNGIPDQILSEAISLLHDQQCYDAVVEGLLSAIRNGYPAPWMYDVLTVEMRLAGRPDKDIARVIASRVDFAASDVPQLLVAVAMLSRFEMYDEANKLALEAAELDPLMPEVWLLSRSVADKSGDPSHRVRVRCGILRHLWTDDFAAQHTEARSVIERIASELDKQSLSTEAAGAREQLADAAAVDLQIVLRWVGNADLDLSVVEPGGATCDFKNRVTPDFGRLIREEGLSSSSPRDGGRRASEHYVAHAARSGTYHVAVRFVIGKAAAGTAVVEIIRHSGTPAETRESQTITLSKDAVEIPIELQDGRSK